MAHASYYTKGYNFVVNGNADRKVSTRRERVGRLADHSRLKVADVIDRALLAYAKQEGFSEPALRR